MTTAGQKEMVGRDVERATVSRLLGHALEGSPSVLLIGGDAGVGKTALATYAARRAAVAGFQVFEGACLDIAANVAFGPVLEAFRPLLAQQEPALSASLGPASAVVSQLLPGATGGSAISPGQALECLREMVARTAAAAPTLVVLEDMHWAEQSTRDFALSVARTAAGPVVLLLTFRTEDIHRRHPFRPCLTEITRSARSERIDLRPLDRTGLAALVERLHGGPADPALIGAILARSEGNPLFVEELLSSDSVRSGVPDRLVDLLLARVDELSDPTRNVVRAASVAGSRVDERLLAAATGRSEPDIESAMQESLDFNVLVQRSGRLEFRHGLLREAVYDDLLPGERARLHQSFAQAVQDRLDTEHRATTMEEASQLAYHWFAAHDLPRSFTASVLAGQLAGRFGAPEAVAHLDRALELWAQVPDAETVAGMSRTHLLCLTAQAVDATGERDRALALIDEALTLVDPDSDPLLASRVYAVRGDFRSFHDPGQQGAIERAVMYAEGTMSVELSHALAALATHLFVNQGRCEAAREVGQRAALIARAVGNAADEAQATYVVAGTRVQSGDIDAGLAEAYDAVDQMERAGRLADSLVYRGSLAFLLTTCGRIPEAIAMARDGASRARDAGLPAAAMYCAGQEVGLYVATGEFEKAELLVRELSDDARTFEHFQSGMEAELWAATGDLDAAADVLTEMRSSVDDLAAEPGAWEWFWPLVELQLARGEVEAAVTLADELLRAGTGDSDLEVAIMARVSLAAVATARVSGPPAPPTLQRGSAQLLARADQLTMAGGCRWGTMAGAEHAAARAWAERTEGRPGADAWRRAHDAWSATGFGYRALQVHAELARALLLAGEHEAARTALVEVAARGRDMGARAITRQVETWARQQHMVLPGTPAAPAGPLDPLTPREREVLDLVAGGASNRAIARALSISEKTASVHVSNLMAKLRVGSRLEAAALAHRVQMLDQSGALRQRGANNEEISQ